MIIDNVAVGEEIGMIDSNRPNPNLLTFRQGSCARLPQVWAAASIARDYSGTYSLQRQELVEQWIYYAMLCNKFVGQSMHWIDLLKGALAWHSLVEDGFASEGRLMRRRGVSLGMRLHQKQTVDFEHGQQSIRTPSPGTLQRCGHFFSTRKFDVV